MAPASFEHVAAPYVKAGCFVLGARDRPFQSVPVAGCVAVVLRRAVSLRAHLRAKYEQPPREKKLMKNIANPVPGFRHLEADLLVV